MLGITMALLLLVILLHFNIGCAFKLNKKSERLDDTELKMLTAQKEKRDMHYHLQNMKGRSNITATQERSPGGEIHRFEENEKKTQEHLGNIKLEAIPEAFHRLKKRFTVEKKQNLRFRRRVSQRDVLGSLSNNSGTLTKNTFAFFEDLRELSEGLKETNKNMKEMYTNTSTVLDSMTMKMANVISSVVESIINRTMTQFSLQFLQHIPCQVSQPKSCLEILKSGSKESGLYSLFPGGHAIQVYCDQETDNGGWTVFQRRQDGSVDFYRNWEAYKIGFGNPTGEFWLGNDNLHRLLTVKSRYELRVDLGDFDDNTVFAKYSRFKVGPESSNYRLTVGGYSGDAGDSLYYHNAQMFSTKDRDNDEWSTSCSQRCSGAWWYQSCKYANLNGLYNTDRRSYDSKNINWNNWKSSYPLQFSEMKFRERV